ncbi:uncharacterized protein KD926_008601 [Aspergillus affinis]|uniref:uncharacterized protein n=1 Tax=Aspergillus affinis TaxID=1070780 RepID=UPI0022FEB7CE|nr:uncharacterized protein KD926_008601 [Aspergillus affinis]KAI9040038.1 hypothetical protein KD926_008601 [Aspergillus affinis]
MVAIPWLTLALGAISVLLCFDGVVATPGYRHSASPSYRNADICPERCSVSGSNIGNWSVYPSLNKIRKCKETLFYDFSLYDNVDDQASNHRIQACSSFGPDFSNLPSSSARIASGEPLNVEFEIGWWHPGMGLEASDIRSLVKQMRTYADHGHGATDRPFIIYGQSGQATIGLYIGQGLLNQGISQSALKIFQDNLENLDVSTPSLAMQLCEPRYDSTHIFGIMASSNGKFASIQDAVRSWANATCLSFSGSTKFTGSAMLTTPLLHTNGTQNLTVRAKDLYNRADGKCKTVQVDAGNGCADLAKKCGISAADFTKYNPGSKFCSTLKPKQHVCCSKGELPDFRPKPNEDGSCKSYKIQEGDNCDNLAAEYSLSKKDLEDFNKKTWGWNGCKLLFKDTVMCLSKGTSPFPAPIANAVCGPQKPGSKPPTDGKDIAKMNPCPLNACCNIWGQCGITKDFCVDTNTGSPGTAKPGTYGCISNCGMDVVKGDGAGAIKIAYYEGYCLSRECLFQDASQIDTSQYTHIHFGFGTLTASYDVEVGDKLSTYEFGEFKRISNAKRILSFGGWDFSTMPATYQIFRNGVKPENRLKMATKIADFIKKHDLDGVDIDWEYPGAPDLPESDPGKPEEGANYLKFLVILKNLLPGKSVSIAAPSSYWYLKQFPIKDIAKIVDYIVYMTYDLHGQWDAHNSEAQEGCDSGNCLRSQVNLTETKQSLAMITKAGVPGKKVVVGVTSYGRSFKMAEAGCWGPECLFTGSRLNSDAKKGKCTGTAGYIADAEIHEILKDPSRVVKSFVDSSSHSDILVYDETEWVGYMSSATKKQRTALYSAWGLGGTSDWASDLQEYHDVPGPSTSWGIFTELLNSGKDPKTDHTRNGNWTEFDCTHPAIVDFADYTPSERWRAVDADAAWRDVVRIWEDTDSERAKFTFMQSVTMTLKIGDKNACYDVSSNDCNMEECPKGADEALSGPAAQLIWNSLAEVHKLHKRYYDELLVVGVLGSFSLKKLENTFAPIPPESDDTWLLLLLDLITLGTLGAGGPMFNSGLKTLPYFAKKGGAFDNAKDTAMTLIGQSTTIAKDVLPGKKPPWTAEAQDAFSSYMGQVIKAWRRITEVAVEDLFDGSPRSIEILQKAIAEGKLIDGKWDGTDSEAGDGSDELESNIARCFYGYTIPALWQVSQTYAFVLDSGYKCDEDKSLSRYLEDDTMKATGVCIDGHQYYLVHPEGASQKCKCEILTGSSCQQVCVDNQFSIPPGLKTLPEPDFGDITKEDLVNGSVRTWIQNGKENVGGFADITKQVTIDNLLNVDITTPGFMRLPVCSPERAFKAWDNAKKGSTKFYPCDPPPNKDHCKESTFVDQTNGASPFVKDCLTIIKNIEDDYTSEWKTGVLAQPHRKILGYGTCIFGVEADDVKGNVQFWVGGQDVIDIINDVVKDFSKDGRVAAYGKMQCKGNIKDQKVKWSIYHVDV